jgi:hypothetical protein
MELKIQVNEETGKIKNIIVDVDKVDPVALKAVFRVIKEELGNFFGIKIKICFPFNMFV